MESEQLILDDQWLSCPSMQAPLQAPLHADALSKQGTRAQPHNEVQKPENKILLCIRLRNQNTLSSSEAFMLVRE